MEAPKPRWNETQREYELRRDAAVIRGPVEWSWDITNECGGGCLHCFNRSGVVKRKELSDEEVRQVARQIAELQPMGICFCGGEPLLRFEAVLDAARIIRSAGATVNTVTNGLLLTEEIAGRLVDAGIHTVQVSLDGAKAETHERLRGISGSFEKALGAIRILKKAEITVGVAFTPTRFNASEWREVYELCTSLGVFELRVQPLMPLGEGHLNYEDLAPTEEQYRDLVCGYKALASNSGPGARVEWGDPVDHLIRFGQFYTMTCYILHLTSDGFLVPSIYLPVVVGNVRRHRIEEYWRAGLSTAWQLRLVRELAYRIRSNRDFARIRPHPCFDALIDLDLIDRSPEEIQRLTDVVLDFVERMDPVPGRPHGPWTFRPRAVRVREFLKTSFGARPNLGKKTGSRSGPEVV